MKLSILFPMAGDGQRFGGTFKPFLDATEKKFIELAKEPFNLFTSDPSYETHFYFIYRRDQEDTYSVSHTLARFFPHDAFTCCILEEPTKGPLETVQQALLNYNVKGAAFVCDCDHSIPLHDIHSYLASNTLPDIIIPTWKYLEKDYESWGKVKMNMNRKPLCFYEKQRVPFSREYYLEGMIGCYFFKEIMILTRPDIQLMTNMSDVFPILLANEYTFQCIRLESAEFFGTPEQLVSFRFERAKKYTFFIDIDGTLLHLPKHVPYDATETIILEGVVEKLYEWRKQGHTIILTTGRETARRDKLIKQLEDLHIPYDQLVTGLASGTRIVLNDKKPYCPFHKMAVAIQLPRNKGFGHVSITSTPELIKKLKGGSFADVFLIEQEGKYLVRKYIEKKDTNVVHVDTLRRQYEDMKRFDYLSNDLVPRIINMYESNDEYYYDMEYLDGYYELSTFSKEVISRIVPSVIKTLKRDIYCFSKHIDGKEWLQNFIKDKISAKYEMIESIDESFYKAVNNKQITINGKEYMGLRAFFETTQLSDFYPKRVSFIHGDLTLENILYHPELNTFRLIDPSGARYVDPIEMDLAKLLQMLAGNYSLWDSIDNLASYRDGNFSLSTDILQMSNYDEICHLYDIPFRVGMFYLSTYFIRMIPFLLVHSPQKALAGLLFALIHLNV